MTTEVLFRDLAKLADGSFVSIQQSGGMVATTTPYDAEMAKLNAAIADRTVVGGAAAARTEGAREIAELKAMPSTAVADRTSFRAKAMPAAPVASVKAVGTVVLNAAPEKVNAMKDEELPDAVRALPKEKREEFVRKQTAEQQQLQAQLTDLSKKRDQFIKDNASKKPSDSFDDQVFENVKKTASKVGVTY
jgi:hypothetical protein